MALDAGAQIELNDYPFEYSNSSYVLWVWKGDYPGWGAGGEIEMFTQKGPLAAAGPVWNADPNIELPLMSMSLTSLGGWRGVGGGKVTSFAPEEAQAWVGSWNTNMQTARVTDLRFEGTATFQSSGMYDAFAAQWGTDENWSFSPQDRTATIRFRRRKGVR